MTEPIMERRALEEKGGDGALLREMVGFAAGQLMEVEVGAKTGADHGKKSSEWLTGRNGYRGRDWQTRVAERDSNCDYVV